MTPRVADPAPLAPVLLRFSPCFSPGRAPAQHGPGPLQAPNGSSPGEVAVDEGAGSDSCELDCKLRKLGGGSRQAPRLLLGRETTRHESRRQTCAAHEDQLTRPPHLPAPALAATESVGQAPRAARGSRIGTAA